MQLPPQYLLQGLVKHYLILEQNAGSQQHYRMFSDGNPGIVFHLEAPLLQLVEGNMEAQPRSFIYGQLTRHNTISSIGTLNMIVVVLQPYALFTHFHTKAHELNDHIIPLDNFFSKETKELEEQVITASTIEAAIDGIEKFLLKRIYRFRHLTRDMVLAMNTIYQQQGIITIENLLKVIPVTERQLERKFNEYIGITPKRFADTIKFQHLLKLLQKQPEQEKIAGLIYESGYYDQAHLNKNFKKMTGFTPAHYKDNSNLLAINLMQVQMQVQV